MSKTPLKILFAAPQCIWVAGLGHCQLRGELSLQQCVARCTGSACSGIQRAAADISTCVIYLLGPASASVCTDIDPAAEFHQAPRPTQFCYN